MTAATDREARALDIVTGYSLAAAATGAVPVPAASIAIVAETVAMIAEVASVMECPVDIAFVVRALGFAPALNMVGRTLFIEGARLLSWGTGSIWALAALGALGASTAGVQTYIIGRLAIAIARNGGQALSEAAAAAVRDDAVRVYPNLKRASTVL